MIVWECAQRDWPCAVQTICQRGKPPVSGCLPSSDPIPPNVPWLNVLGVNTPPCTKSPLRMPAASPAADPISYRARTQSQCRASSIWRDGCPCAKNSLEYAPRHFSWHSRPFCLIYFQRGYLYRGLARFTVPIDDKNRREEIFLRRPPV